MGETRADIGQILVVDGVDESFNSYAPENLNYFGVQLEVFAGPGGAARQDAFNILVCTPGWFADEVERRNGFEELGDGPDGMPDEVCPGRGLWFMQSWDAAKLEHALLALCQASSPGPDWEEVAERLGRWLAWEYDYRRDRAVNKRAGLPAPGTSE